MLSSLVEENEKLACNDGTIDCIVLFSKTDKWIRIGQALHEKACEF